MSEAIRKQLDEAAFHSYVQWALGQENVRRQFKEETGAAFLPLPSTVLDSQAGETTGTSDSIGERFVYWCACKWGWNQVPVGIRTRLDHLHSQKTRQSKPRCEKSLQ